MNQKQLIQFAVIIVAGVWIACGSFFVSTKIAESKAPDTTVPVATTAQQTTAPTLPAGETLAATTIGSTASIEATTKPTTTAPSTTLNIGGNNIVTTAPQADAPDWQLSQLAEQSKQDAQSSFQAVKDSIPKTKKEIISTYIKAVNDLKKTEGFTMHKDDKLNLTIDEITGGTLVQTFADQLMANNQKKPITYKFENGIDSATNKTPVEVIAPLGKEAALTEKGILDARSAVTDSEGGYAIKISLIDEHQIYPNDASVHSKTVEVVDVDSLMISGMEITSLDILYSGATIEAKFDKDGRITSMTHRLPVSKAEGSGKYGIINAKMAMHGEFTSVYTFTY